MVRVACIRGWRAGLWRLGVESPICPARKSSGRSATAGGMGGKSTMRKTVPPLGGAIPIFAAPRSPVPEISAGDLSVVQITRDTVARSGRTAFCGFSPSNSTTALSFLSTVVTTRRSSYSAIFLSSSRAWRQFEQAAGERSTLRPAPNRCLIPRRKNRGTRSAYGIRDLRPSRSQYVRPRRFLRRAPQAGRDVRARRLLLPAYRRASRHAARAFALARHFSRRRRAAHAAAQIRAAGLHPAALPSAAAGRGDLHARPAQPRALPDRPRSRHLADRDRLLRRRGR